MNDIVLSIKDEFLDCLGVLIYYANFGDFYLAEVRELKGRVLEADFIVGVFPLFGDGSAGALNFFPKLERIIHFVREERLEIYCLKAFLLVLLVKRDHDGGPVALINVGDKDIVEDLGRGSNELDGRCIDNEDDFFGLLKL